MGYGPDILTPFRQNAILKIHKILKFNKAKSVLTILHYIIILTVLKTKLNINLIISINIFIRELHRLFHFFTDTTGNRMSQ